MTTKYSKGFNRDWDFYIKNIGRLTFWGGDEIYEPVYSPDAVTAKEYFYQLDSKGIKGTECKEPEQVVNVIKLKKAINFHIKMWAEGYDECLMGINEYLEVFVDPPEWLRTALMGQVFNK